MFCTMEEIRFCFSCCNGKIAENFVCVIFRWMNLKKIVGLSIEFSAEMFVYFSFAKFIRLMRFWWTFKRYNLRQGKQILRKFDWRMENKLFKSMFGELNFWILWEKLMNLQKCHKGWINKNVSLCVSNKFLSRRS